MTKEEYNKYKYKVDFYYHEVDRVSRKCVYCSECRKYLPVENFPRYGQVNEYKTTGSLCTNCYTEKYKITQEFFEETISSFICECCDRVIPTAEYFRPYARHNFKICNSCYNDKKKEDKERKRASALLKKQGIKNITNDVIKIKLLTLNIKKSIRNTSSLKFKKLTTKEKKQVIKNLK